MKAKSLSNFHKQIILKYALLPPHDLFNLCKSLNMVDYINQINIEFTMARCVTNLLSDLPIKFPKLRIVNIIYDSNCGTQFNHCKFNFNEIERLSKFFNKIGLKMFFIIPEGSVIRAHHFESILNFMICQFLIHQTDISNYKFTNILVDVYCNSAYERLMHKLNIYYGLMSGDLAASQVKFKVEQVLVLTRDGFVTRPKYSFDLLLPQNLGVSRPISIEGEPQHIPFKIGTWESTLKIYKDTLKTYFRFNVSICIKNEKTLPNNSNVYFGIYFPSSTIIGRSHGNLKISSADARELSKRLLATHDIRTLPDSLLFINYSYVNLHIITREFHFVKHLSKDLKPSTFKSNTVYTNFVKYELTSNIKADAIRNTLLMEIIYVRTCILHHLKIDRSVNISRFGFYSALNYLRGEPNLGPLKNQNIVKYVLMENRLFYDLKYMRFMLQVVREFQYTFYCSLNDS